jgi:hypothetical protein
MLLNMLGVAGGDGVASLEDRRSDGEPSAHDRVTLTQLVGALWTSFATGESDGRIGGSTPSPTSEIGAIGFAPSAGGASHEDAA